MPRSKRVSGVREIWRVKALLLLFAYEAKGKIPFDQVKDSVEKKAIKITSGKSFHLDN